jgi:hypothetical protein
MVTFLADAYVSRTWEGYTESRLRRKAYVSPLGIETVSFTLRAGMS